MFCILIKNWNFLLIFCSIDYWLKRLRNMLFLSHLVVVYLIVFLIYFVFQVLLVYQVTFVYSLLHLGGFHRPAMIKVINIIDQKALVFTSIKYWLAVSWGLILITCIKWVHFCSKIWILRSKISLKYAIDLLWLLLFLLNRKHVFCIILLLVALKQFQFANSAMGA